MQAYAILFCIFMRLELSRTVVEALFITILIGEVQVVTLDTPGHNLFYVCTAIREVVVLDRTGFLCVDRELVPFNGPFSAIGPTVERTVDVCQRN